MAAREPVKLRVANQKAYLWDLNDIQYLRVQHHICGVLSGTLPQVTQQNVFLGLPLVLMPEEVVLLVRNGLAVLVDDREAHLPPTHAQAESYHASRAAAVQSQQETHYHNEQAKKREMEELHRDKIEKRRREKEEARRKRAEEDRERRRVAEGEDAEDGVFDTRIDVAVSALEPGAANTGPPAGAATVSSTSSSGDGASTAPVPAQPPKDADTRPDLSTFGYTIIIEPRSDSFAWYDPDRQGVSFSSLEAAASAGAWSYPQTTLQETRCRVFEDLWRRGFYMGGGMRFGGDFLVYPGDPLRYHSHFTLTVLSTPTTTIMPLDLVAYGRLATAVKKAHLLGTWDDEKKAAEYTSLEWAAFG
ncbi:hypothetical protein JCM8202_006068 [Rhodotorula sphaerocarpa]